MMVRIGGPFHTKASFVGNNNQYNSFLKFLLLSLFLDTIRALIVLSQNLPHDIASRDNSASSTWAVPEDIIEVVGVVVL